MDKKSLSDKKKIRQRAGGSLEKNEKREGIIEIAEKLMKGREYNLPSVNEIIAASGIAKGTFYLYFKTKEEIYIAMLKKYHRILFDELDDALQNVHSINDFHLKMGDVMTSFAQNHPKAMYLAYIANVILENNLQKEIAIDFKQYSAQRISNLLEQIATKFKINPDQFRAHLIITYNLWLSLWQYTNPPKSMEKLFQNNTLEVLMVPFAKTFHMALKKIWQE